MAYKNMGKFEEQFEEEVLMFLRKQDIKISDIDSVTFADLRHRLEKQKCRKLSVDEKKLFLEIANDFMAHQLDKLDNKHEINYPSNEEIVNLDDNNSLFEDSSEVSFKTRLHPNMEGSKKSNRVEIFLNSDFDLHATVNGSPIKVLGTRENIEPQNSTKRKFNFISKRSTENSPNSVKTSENRHHEEDYMLASPTNFTKSSSQGTNVVRNLTPVSNIYRKKLQFKKSTPLNRSDSCLPDFTESEVTPHRKSKSLGHTPESVKKSSSKRKLIIEEEENSSTDGVWLTAGVPPPKSKQRLSDIITITENTEESNRSTNDMPQCPICMGYFPAADLEEHGAQCARLAFGDGKSRIPETPPCGSVQNKSVALSDPSADPSEGMVECPICTNLFLESRISAHADMCADGAFS